MSASKKLGVGIIGAGEVFQVCHGPCLLMMPHLFTLESICDLSPICAAHCAAKFKIPHHTTEPQEVLDNPRVDVVFILTTDDCHALIVIAALRAGKYVLVEKPLSLSIPSVQSILAAERAAGGGHRVFVGYMRRHAPSYLQAFKREVASMDKVLYARVRDFSGPNAYFVSGSGTFPIKPRDFPVAAATEVKARLETLFGEAFPGQMVTDAHRQYCRFLGSLGSHDFSLMRETLGFPERVVGVSVNEPFYSSIMEFRNRDGSPFYVTYESGIDKVPVFDAHLAVYGSNKRVTIKYDSPYVKGLPIKVEVDEVNAAGEVQHREMLSSYQDTYTAELCDFYECVVHGKPIKTTTEDALQDLTLYDMMYKAWARQNRQLSKM